MDVNVECLLVRLVFRARSFVAGNLNAVEIFFLTFTQKADVVKKKRKKTESLTPT